MSKHVMERACPMWMYIVHGDAADVHLDLLVVV
jgi:hypothetical protein